MRSQHEAQVFSAVIQDSQIEGQYLVETSSQIFSPKIPGEIISWENIFIPKLSACGSFFDGSYYLQKQTYDDWVLINNQTYLLTPFIANKRVTIISRQECDRLCDGSNYTWSVFYFLTRPGFSPDFSQAIIQIYGHCPAGSPQYGSILYLDRTHNKWQVTSSCGLYNQ